MTSWAEKVYNKVDAEGYRTLYSMAYLQIYYHLVWRTYDSHPTINERYERDLYAYILGLTRNMGCKLHRINSMPDHMHMLVGVPPTMAIADFVKRVKLSAGNFMKANADKFPNFDGWGKSYCCLSVSHNAYDSVYNYIANQKSHHGERNFATELSAILRENGVEYDEKYFLKD